MECVWTLRNERRPNAQDPTLLAATQIRGAEAERTVDPDIVVFGRHRMLKAKPYLIGRMGFRAMLEARRPVLMVPPQEQLYAALPFPVRGDD